MSDTKKRVMIVDDAPFMQNIIKKIFEKNGFEVTACCSNGKEACEKYEEIKPDFVTMDIVMPEMGGLEAVQKIIQIDPQAKVIMISSMGMKDKVMSAVEAGAKNFILKPFDEQKVLETVNQVIGA